MKRPGKVLGGIVAVVGGIATALAVARCTSTEASRGAGRGGSPSPSEQGASPHRVERKGAPRTGSVPRNGSGSHDDESALHPGAPGYTAALVYEVTGGNMQEIYADEPRTEPWATTREQAIVAYVEEDILHLDPEAKIEADCRTSSCRIRVTSTNRFLTDEMGDFPFACMARYGTADLGMTDPEHPGALFGDYYILFGDQNLDDSAFEQNRERTCPQYREPWRERVTKPFDSLN